MVKHIELTKDSLIDRYGEAVAQFILKEMEKAARMSAASFPKRRPKPKTWWN